MLYFFLSYARGDDDIYVERFFRDLCAEVRVLTGTPREEEVGFFDNHSIEPGERWSPALVEALSECQSFLALCAPTYFLSEPCGKEWTIFSERARHYEERTGNRCSALIPLVWLPQRTMPAAASTIQYTTSVLGESYNKGGLRQLLRLQRNLDTYLEFVTAVAERIISAATHPPVPASANGIDFDRIPSAFHQHYPASQPLTCDDPGGDSGDAVGSTSQFVYFVVAAASRVEAGTVRRDLRYYGERPQDWAPYHPTFERPISEYARRVAADRSFESTVVTIDELNECIRQAHRHNQIVVLLVDAWSTKLDRHRRVLREYDERNEPTTAVMIPWSHTDPETQNNGTTLADALQATFMNNSLRRDDVMFRSSVLTHAAFGADLQVVLEVARNRVFVRGTVYRRPTQEIQSTRPILEGP